MDDLAHDARHPCHTLNRKRKADQDDHPQVPPPAPLPDPPSTADAIRIDLNMTPRRPADPPNGPASSAWMLARARQRMPMTPWPKSPSASPTPAVFMPAQRDGQPSAKRLRIEIPSSAQGSPSRARRPQRPSPRTSQRRRRAGETRDTGIVSATEPGPSSGSLLRPSRQPAPSAKSHSLPVSPIDPCSLSPHIPPHQPPINRETLKELDLDAILRNPQLRHDLLFDSGLQFRPTSSRRKRDLADHYWLTIVRELETGCTCTTVDVHGKLAELRCVCDPAPHAPEKPTVKYLPGHLATVRTHSRIRPLLTELLEVLISIIQPPRAPALRPPELLFPPAQQHPQFQQNVVHIALLRQHLDPDLILQEISHGLFDPSGLFQVIGDIIRRHCAPMRDGAVDQMVGLARACAPGGGGTKLDAVRAIRMCFEIMELMKLVSADRIAARPHTPDRFRAPSLWFFFAPPQDVANHQLQTLRPYLVRTAGEYEVQIFSDERHNARRTIHTTRAWLGAAWRELADGTGAQAQAFARATRQTQALMAVVKATVNLIFDPPPPGTASPPPSSQSTPVATVAPSSSSSTSSSSTSSSTSSSSSSSSSSSRPSSRAHPSSSSHAAYYAGYPETFYLDYGRFGTLHTDAADFTALYMLLMMYRQLVHSPLARAPHARADAVAQDTLARLKKEIWEIGPAHPGLCFMQGRRPGACSLGSSRTPPPAAPAASSSAPAPATAAATAPVASSGSSSSSRHERDREAELRRWRAEIEDVALQVAMHASEPRGASLAATKASVEASAERTLHAPDMQVVKFALGWTAANLRHGSPFSVLCRRRLRERVEEAVLAIVLAQQQQAAPAADSAGAPVPAPASAPVPATPTKDASQASSGLEPLGAEIKHISQRAAKMVEIHMNVYGELYAHPAFLDKDVLPSAAAVSSSGASSGQMSVPVS
ncbi:T-complex protein 11-domain-containing protein [Lenzites betulinus]|nr:T-complex protein 11-domain-containing protein [Lenzites betulinus]